MIKMLLSAFSSSLFSVFTNHIVSILTFTLYPIYPKPPHWVCWLASSCPCHRPHLLRPWPTKKGMLVSNAQLTCISNLFEIHWENKMKIQCKIHQKLQTTDLLQNYYLVCPFKPQKIENEKQQSFFIKQASFQMSKLFKNKKNPNEWIGDEHRIGLS